MKGIIGKKSVQTQAFLTDGTRIPVTVITVVDNTVLAVKTADKDGYTAVQLGYGKRKKASKAVLGHVKKANLSVAPLVVKEIREDLDASLPAVGDMIGVESVFKPGDIVKVTGKSKGKGFAGVVKKHNFRGGPRTHGQSDRERAPGSLGQTTTPGRVYRGKKMAGRMGNEIVSALNLQVVDVTVKGDKKSLFIKGLVPGSLNSIVTIIKTGELPEKKVLPLIKTEEPEVTVSELTETQAELKVEEAVAEPAVVETPVEETKEEAK